MLKTIQDNILKDLLEQKSGLVTKGRDKSIEIEEKCEPILVRWFSEYKIVPDGVSDETYGDGTKFYANFKGSFLNLRTAFSKYSLFEELISKELEDDLNENKANELQLAKLNEKINDRLTELLPTLELGEFEQVNTITLRGIDIDIDILDMVENYKLVYRTQKAEAMAKLTPIVQQEATQDSPANDSPKVE
jgi:hypothetical protein